MARPILLAVDDDVNVLEAVVQDLRRHYGAEYRVMRAASGQAALDTLAQVKAREEPVALLLSDQRMPGMTGVEFLERSREDYPGSAAGAADRLCGYRSGDPGDQHGAHSLLPEQALGSAGREALPGAERSAGRLEGGLPAGIWGLRVIGHRWSLRDHTVRSFLSCNHVPYRWIDIAGGEDALKLLEERQLDPDKLPVVLFPDGSALVDPEPEALAAKVGLSIQATQEFYDLIMVGAGPAGLAAAVYGASEGLSTLVVEPEAPGGQAGTTSRIENYLGFPAGITGADMGRRAHIQATRFGAEFVTQRATGLRVDGQYRFLQLADGREVSSHVVLLAPGVQYRKLEIPGGDRLTGRGIYYGAALVEAAACKDEEVFVVGGANSAGQAALVLLQVCAKRDHAGARQGLDGHHVEILNR